jgi:hypothetical protein
MPFHLELGSEGHKFADHRAIVVNSRTGEHLTRFPINKTDAEIVKSVAEKNPNFLKAEKKIAEEADKKVKALAGLRKVESETKERNTKKAQEVSKKAEEAKKAEDAKKPWNRVGKAFLTGVREVHPDNSYGKYIQVLSGVSELEEEIKRYIKSVFQRTKLASRDDDYFPVKLRPDGDKWRVLFDSDDIDVVSKQSSALSYGNWEQHISKVKSIFETENKLYKEKKAKEREELSAKIAKDKADILAKEAEDAKMRKAKLTEAESKRKSKSGLDDNLTEFIGTAPEDLTGVDYGRTKKQRGVITKMVGDITPIKSMIEQSHSNNATFGAAELIGLLFLISLVADKRDSNTIVRTSSEYGKSAIDPKEVETPADKYYDRSVRLLVNHFPKLKTGGEPKDLKSRVGHLILPPTTKALDTLRTLLPGVSLEAQHKTGAYGTVSRDKYEAGVSAKDLNLRTKAGKDELEKRAQEASEKATDILNSFFIQLREGAYLYLEKTDKAVKEKKSVLKASGMNIPKGEKNKAEVPLTREGLYEMSLAITGDETRANKYVEEHLSDYQAKGRAGKKLYVYLARTSYHLKWE